jgi:hypothetical protein
VYEMTPDGVVFSRSEPDAGEYDPGAKIAAAAFLGPEGSTADLGSLDQVVYVAAYSRGFKRCPVLVSPEVKVNGVRSTPTTNSAQIRPGFTRRAALLRRGSLRGRSPNNKPRELRRGCYSSHSRALNAGRGGHLGGGWGVGAGASDLFTACAWPGRGGAGGGRRRRPRRPARIGIC